MPIANQIGLEQKATFPSMPKENFRHFGQVMYTPPWRNRRREGRGPRDFNLDSRQGRISNQDNMLNNNNNGHELESIPTNHIVLGSLVGMKEDKVLSQVVVSKKDDPKSVNCDGQSALTMGSMAIDPRGALDAYGNPVEKGQKIKEGNGQGPIVPNFMSHGLERKWLVESANLMAIPKTIVDKQYTKEIAYVEGTKAQSVEITHQVNNSTSKSTRLHKMFCPSSIESRDPMIEAPRNGHWNFNNKTLIHATKIKS
eukprot:Gb_41774 [translate_table: standard]